MFFIVLITFEFIIDEKTSCPIAGSPTENKQFILCLSFFRVATYNKSRRNIMYIKKIKVKILNLQR